MTKELEVLKPHLRSEAVALAARSGVRTGKMDDLAKQTWRDRGFLVIGKHTPNCHSIGLDESDGLSSTFTPEEPLQANIILSFHPSRLLEGYYAFLISDNSLVTNDGAVRIAAENRTYMWIHALPVLQIHRPHYATGTSPSRNGIMTRWATVKRNW